MAPFLEFANCLWDPLVLVCEKSSLLCRLLLLLLLVYKHNWSKTEATHSTACFLSRLSAAGKTCCKSSSLVGWMEGKKVSIFGNSKANFTYLLFRGNEAAGETLLVVFFTISCCFKSTNNISGETMSAWDYLTTYTIHTLSQGNLGTLRLAIIFKINNPKFGLLRTTPHFPSG